MTHENDAGAVEGLDETEVEETQGRRSWTGYGLFSVALVILAVGTSQVLSSNAEREDQARRVKAAQSQMELLN